MPNHANEIQTRDGVAVVLYGKKPCVQCDATERKFRKHNVHFTKVDVTEDPTALEFIKKLGHQQAPVVYVSAIDGDVHWSGYDVDQIALHITERPDAA